MKGLDGRRKELKSALRARQKLFFGWTSFGHPSLTEIIANSGVEALGIDLEHSTISLEQTQRIIAAAQGEGILALPRIASHNPEMLKRVLDSGADGVIVPLVSSREQAERFISLLRYAPQGLRNFGVSRAHGYGFDFEAYTRDWNAGAVLIAQIETKEGVENIDAILAGGGIDGIMIGPYDMSGSYGLPGQLDHGIVREACQRVIRACAARGVSCGIHLVSPDENEIHEAFKRGYTFLVLSSDLFAMWKWAERTRELIKMAR